MNPVEVEGAPPIVLLGADTAEQLFAAADPLDKVIKIGGTYFRVVSQKKGSVFGRGQDEFAVIALGAFEKLFGNRTSLQILVKPETPELTAAAVDEATVAMRIQRRLRPSQPDNVGIFSSDTLLGLYRTVTSGIFAVLLGVVGLSLVVGGIVIMNIMLRRCASPPRWRLAWRITCGASRKS